MANNAADIVVGGGVSHVGANKAVFNSVGATPCKAHQAATMVSGGINATGNLKVFDRCAADIVERSHTLFSAAAGDTHRKRVAMAVEGASERIGFITYHVAFSHRNV